MTILPVTILDKFGCSLLMRTCENVYSSSNLDAFCLLVHYGSDVNYQCLRDGRTALHYAVNANSMQAIEFLLKHNASTEIKDNEGLNVYQYAMQSNCSIELIQAIKYVHNIKARALLNKIAALLPVILLFLIQALLGSRSAKWKCIFGVCILIFVFLSARFLDITKRRGILESSCFLWNHILIAIILSINWHLTKISNAFAIVYVVTCLLLGYTIRKLSLSDPGFLYSSKEDIRKILRDIIDLPKSPQEQPDYYFRNFRKTLCFACGLKRINRSFHCRACDMCVNRFDHHCYWLNKCIGQYNYSTFLQIVGIELIHYFCSSIVSVKAYNQISKSLKYWNLKKWPLMYSLFGSLLPLFIFTLITIQHMFQIYTMKTTQEIRFGRSNLQADFQKHLQYTNME
ncbi:hypothetical protein GJ496_004099 [Pomphorhynchus laevis]|nr:hypothetical protein GJ496_004099 [Pomphorhynchus laevis]